MSDTIEEGMLLAQSLLKLKKDIAPDLADRVFTEDNIIYVSEEVRGKPSLVSFVSCAKKLGDVGVCWLPPSTFDEKYSQASQDDTLADSEIINQAKMILKTAYELNATDIHISYRGRYGIIDFRRLGNVENYSKISGQNCQRLIRCIFENMGDSASEVTFSDTLRQDARIVKREFLPSKVYSVRIHTEPIECAEAEGSKGTYMALRLLFDTVEVTGGVRERALTLGYTPEDVTTLLPLTLRTGLNLISGPTGGGKSTFLRHIMEGLAEETPEKNFISYEDPPEYPMKNVKQGMILTGGSGDDDLSNRQQAYVKAIAGAMRSDPDVIMIGEIRYAEAVLGSITAAQSGHGVWATIHANNALGIVTRIKAMLEEAGYANPLKLLCGHNVLAGLIYQRLLPELCPHCSLPLAEAKGTQYDIRDDLKDRLRQVTNSMENIRVLGAGCEHCKGLGIIRQRVVAEVIHTDTTLLDHLRRDDMQGAEDYWRDELHGVPYMQKGIELIEQGVIDPKKGEERLGVYLTYDARLIKNKS